MPLRANPNAGGIPALVEIEGYSDIAYRKALESLNIVDQWYTAILDACAQAGNSNCAFWWERMSVITTTDPEWTEICTQMVWGSTSEQALIQQAASY